MKIDFKAIVRNTAHKEFYLWLKETKGYTKTYEEFLIEHNFVEAQ